MKYERLSGILKALTVLFACAVAGFSLGIENRAEAQSVSVDYGSQKIWVGEPNRITFSVANATDFEDPILPEVDGLDFVFVGAVNTASSITIINGVRSESNSVDLTVEIMPQHAGSFVVPGIKIEVDGSIYESKPFTFDAITATNDGRLIVDIERAGGPVYIGEPIQLVLQIWVKVFHSDRLDMTVNESTTWRLIKHNDSEWGPFAESLQTLGRSGRRPNGRLVKREGGDYYLYEITRDLRTTGIGAIDELSDINISMSYPMGLIQSRSRSIFRRSDVEFSGLMPIRARAEVQPIDVMPLPEEGRPEYFRGAVGDFIVRAGARPTDVAVGDPITVTLLVGSLDGDPSALDTLRPPPLAEMTELTEFFRIPKDPIAGEIEDTIKLFSQTLRPRSEEVTEIPPIPFSFFDPDRGEYQTVWTQAIPIQVRPAETLAAADIVRAGDQSSISSGDGSTPTENDEEIQAGLRANFPLGPGMLSTSSRTLGYVTLGVVAIPPAFFAAIAMFAARRRWKQSHTALIRSRSASNRAQNTLRSARDETDIALAIRGYVCDRSGRPATSLTSSETMRLARQAGADAPLLANMDDLFRSLERSGYSGNNVATTMQSKEAAEVIRELDRCQWSTPKEMA
jgi:hypothetical protein